MHTYKTEVIAQTAAGVVVLATSSDVNNLPGRYTIAADGTITDWRGRKPSKRAYTLRDALLTAVRQLTLMSKINEWDRA